MKEIAIIGAGGRMGSWITKYFVNNKNFSIKVYDKNMDSIERQVNIKIEIDFNVCIKDSDIVILCIPLRISPQMIAECSQKMKPNSVLIDISSIKSKSFKSLAKIQNSISPICIHPMFGPGASHTSRLKTIFIPVRNYTKEVEFVRQLFPNFEILPIENAIKHDHIMAVVLGLNHYMNIIFADVISSHIYKNLEFYYGNTFIKKEIKNFHKKFLKYSQMVNDKNDKKLTKYLKNIKSTLEEYHDLNSSYAKIYKFIDLLNNNKN